MLVEKKLSHLGDQITLRVAVDNINIKGIELMKIFGWEILWKSIFYYGHWKVRKIKDVQ